MDAVAVGATGVPVGVPAGTTITDTTTVTLTVTDEAGFGNVAGPVQITITAAN